MEIKITPLLTALREQKEMKMKGSIYHKTQIDLTYNSNLYYRGLREWGHIDGYLTDTCLTAQDNYKAVLDYFRIKY